MTSFQYEIQPGDIVSVLDCGNFLEVTCCEIRNQRNYIKRLSKDYYLDLRDDTGEVKEFNHTDCRLENVDSIRRSLKLARDRINTNCTDSSCIKWVTLTYAENMTDTERLYKDFKLFVRKTRREYGHFEYIVACEPQERGAWHMHVIMLFEGKAPYMANRDVFQLWGQGFVDVQNVKNVDNLGAYLSAYLADIPVPEGYEENLNPGQVVTKLVDGVPKRFVKGARLDKYPSGMQIFRYSHGLKQPQEFEIRYHEFLENFDCKLTYERSYNLVNDEKGSCFSIKKEFYKKV